MECEGQNYCGAAVDIKTIVNELAPNTWQSLSIDMRCFSKAGMKMGDLTSQFKLTSKGQFTLDLANITVESIDADYLTMSCR
jgi:beta-glucosidase